MNPKIYLINKKVLIQTTSKANNKIQKQNSETAQIIAKLEHKVQNRMGIINLDGIGILEMSEQLRE